MIELRIGEMESSRGHLYGVVTALSDGEVLFQDTVRLERADSRRQFAAGVVQVATDLGIEVDQAAIERKLLEILSEAATEAEAPGPAAEGLLALLGGKKPAELLIDLVADVAFFHTPDRKAYAIVPVGTHRETWALDSMAFKTWLKGRYYAKHKNAPRADAVRDALGVLESRSQYDGQERTVYTRVAELGGAIYLDLANEDWQAVEVTAGGWRIVDDPPVRFRRPKGMLPLPLPVRGGNLDALRRFVNVRDGDWLLLLSWVLMTLRDRGPYPVLLVYGQQGSAKSTIARVLRWLLDPNQALIRARPRDEVDLLIAARGGSIVAFDNLSFLTDDLSDAICRLATGGSIGRRALYTNSEETLLDAMRPVILNGIEELARRGDLADRGLALDVPPIEKRQRRHERTFWKEFKAAHPAILGAVLDAAATAIAEEPDVALEELPRMADFAVWAAAAAAPALGWTAEAFLAAYEANLRDRDQTVLDDSPLTRFVVELVDAEGAWEGTTSELLADLSARADDRTLKDKRWPKDATRLSGALRRLTPSLQAVGVGLEAFRAPGTGKRLIRLWATGGGDTPDGDAPTDTREESTSRGNAASPASQASQGPAAYLVGAAPARDATRESSVTGRVSPQAGPEPERPHDARGTTCDAARDATNGHSVTLVPGGRDARDARDTRMHLLSETGDGAATEASNERSDRDADANAGAEGSARAGGRLGAGASERAALLRGGLDPADAADQRGPSGAGSAVGDAAEQGRGPGSVAVGHRATSGPVIVLTDASAVRAALSELVAAPVLGIDTETLGLDPRAHRVRLVQLAAPDGQTYVVDCFSVDPRLLAPLFDPTSGPVLIGHHLKFDLQMLAEAGLPVPNGARLFDTQLAANLLEAGVEHAPKGHFTLGAVAERYVGVTIDKGLQMSDWSGALSDEQVQYAARDAAVLLELHEVMREQLRVADLERVAALEMRALPAIVWLERTGAPFDAEAWTTLAEQAARRQLEIERALADETGTLDMFGNPTVKWGGSKQAVEILAQRGHAVTNADEDTLTALVETEPLARLILDYREQAKLVGTYGLGILKHLSPVTGRMHADWMQLGSRAGRMACSRPNLQQVPGAPAYRACIRPADGRALVKADYSQIELRIVAEIANDARLLAAYAAGEDVHTLTAAEVLGRRNGEVTKADRQAAKAINFGLMYGCGVPRLRTQARKDYGVELSEAEGNRFRRQFFTTYRGLKAWHRQHPGQERPIDTRTLAGRRRLGVTSFTEQINTPIQGTGADGFKAALALLWETRSRVPSAAPVLVVHDEIVLECDRADVEEAQAWLTDCMIRGMAAFLTRVPVVVEATIERDWSGTPLAVVAGGEE